ncbi:MAG: glycosyltransferase family 2 protein [Pseudomonadota bacterium]
MQDLSLTDGADEPIIQSPRLSIFIVAYHSAELIAECIQAIGPASTKQSFEILLVDNGDGSTEAVVSENFPEVKIIQSRGNIGFAAGNNWLAQHALADLYLLLNPDMVLAPGAIDALVTASEEHADAAAWGGVSLDKSGIPDTGNALIIPSLTDLLSTAIGRSNNANPPSADLQRDSMVDVLMGGFVMFRKSAWDEVGGLDERFFLYCEEVDLFYRLAQRGHSFWRVAGARGVHDAGHGEAFSPRRNLYRVAGIVEFARRHWRSAAVVCAVALIWIAAAGRFVVGAVFGRWRTRLKLLGKANARIAAQPRLWAYGYDPQRGLLAQLGKTENRDSL